MKRQLQNFKANLDLELKDYIFDEGAIELGVYCLCLIVCMILLLGKLRGKP